MAYRVTVTARNIASLVSPVKEHAIIGLDSASKFLTMVHTDEDVESVRVFASEPITSKHLEVIHLCEPAPADKSIVRFLGCWCTSPLQTFKDILTPGYGMSSDAIEEILTAAYIHYDNNLEHFRYFLTKEQWEVLQEHLPAVKAMLRY